MIDNNIEINLYAVDSFYKFEESVHVWSQQLQSEKYLFSSY